MDFITDLPTTEDGYDMLLVYVDKLSKMVHLRACKETDGAEEIAWYFLSDIFQHHGLPQAIICEQKRSAPRCMKMSTAFHPQTDGQTERMNRTVKTHSAPMLATGKTSGTNSYH